MQPKVLILDEPTAGLDPSGRDEILYKIRDMHERMGLTVLLVSHSMEDVAALADRIFVMNGGKLAMADTPDKIFIHSDALTAMGLDVPNITAIADGLRGAGIPLPEGIFTLDAAEHAILQLEKREG